MNIPIIHLNKLYCLHDILLFLKHITFIKSGRQAVGQSRMTDPLPRPSPKVDTPHLQELERRLNWE